MPAAFRDLMDVAEAFGWPVILAGTYYMTAAAEDDIVHFAELTIGRVDGMVLFIPCRRLVIDGKADALTHLQRPEVPVDCMTCLVRQCR